MCLVARVPGRLPRCGVAGEANPRVDLPITGLVMLLLAVGKVEVEEEEEGA